MVGESSDHQSQTVCAGLPRLCSVYTAGNLTFESLSLSIYLSLPLQLLTLLLVHCPKRNEHHLILCFDFSTLSAHLPQSIFRENKPMVAKVFGGSGNKEIKTAIRTEWQKKWSVKDWVMNYSVCKSHKAYPHNSLTGFTFFRSAPEKCQELML